MKCSVRSHIITNQTNAEDAARFKDFSWFVYKCDKNLVNTSYCIIFSILQMKVLKFIKELKPACYYTHTHTHIYIYIYIYILPHQEIKYLYFLPYSVFLCSVRLRQKNIDYLFMQHSPICLPNGSRLLCAVVSEFSCAT